MAKTLRLLLNIGRPDAQRLHLDKTAFGDVVSVDDEVAGELITRGWATEETASNRPEPEAVPTSSATPRPGEADKRPQPAAEKKTNEPGK